MFDEHNALAKISRFVRDRLDAGVVQNVKIRLFANRSGQGREYDLPSANELAGLIIDETGKDTFSLDIIIQHQSNELERITFYHPSLMALQYPILFPYGEADWHANIMVRNAGQTRNTMRGDSDLEHTGKHIILASSHTGSPRYKYENFQDAVAICRTLGFPGLFITFTCNTQWPEVEYMISLLLEVEKKDPNHAEVLARVFKLKLNRSMSEIKTKEIFGRCIASSQEVFYLRMLLHTVKGCTSFEDIRTVNGKTYDSFKQTCNAHGFLTDDGEWNHCLEEVSFTATAREMRKLFVTKLLYCQVSDVKSLWEKNWTLLSDDILFSRRQELRLPNLELSIEETKILCLLQLQNILRGFGKTLADIQGLPAPPVDSTLHLSNSLLAEEMNYDCAALQAQFQSNFMKLNTEQKAAYNQIMESVETNGHQLFFIDGRAILAPFHETVSSVNDYMQNKFPREQACYYSSNSIQTDDIEATDLEAEFPPEFLNSLKLGNFPDHELKLKVGVPVILLRNIDQATGLYNGTRMIVKSLGTWSIEVEVLTGSHIGDKVYLS
ncbi:hypothetical protein LINPERPRIM_LOCUS22310 [Linum perenne]